MPTEKTDRGFIVVTAEKYQNEPGELITLLQESSAIGDYDDALENPGSSFLWVGGYDHHLSREQVIELMNKMQYWLDNKRLPLEKGE